MAVVVAIDAGTTGVRSMAVDSAGCEAAYSYREFPQYFPRPGRVEHDATEIWHAVVATLTELCARLDELGEAVAAVGIANQRETAVAWRRSTGEPVHRAIVWQDVRTAERCAELVEQGRQPTVRARTGLLIDPYFSATKFEWLMHHATLPPLDDLALGTVDSWLLWKLSGQGGAGADGVPLHATDFTNASRTMLFGIGPGDGWDGELCELFGVPTQCLAEVFPSAGRITVTGDTTALGAGVPVSGVAGDQQAALFGQACFDVGDAKATYGTGSFVLMNVGTTLPPPADGLLTTRAVGIGDDPVYALEGSVFATGAAIQWLRDGLGIISAAEELGPLAASVPDSGGVFVVPAFAGLGSPWWDPNARGTVVGLTRGTGRAHLARAVVEAIAFQVRDVTDVMGAAAGHPVAALRVDGGAAAMDLLLQLQADQLGVVVSRPRNAQTTAMGAAMTAGLAEGVWGSTTELRAAWQLDREFEPAGGADVRAEADRLHEQWLRAVERSRDWVQPH
ncbi:MAG TPA: glycerol kinase [Acidimicrobiaceae bacterium]|nr:glycerol kinase [Acidimicrobiaceae bacterium]